METTFQPQTKETLDHHLGAFIETDVNEIMKDYEADSELLTPQGALKGKDAIRSFFEEIFKLLPKGSAFGLKQEIIRGNIAYVVWEAGSTFVTIPVGTDTFIMNGDKIKYQSLAAHIIPKQ